MRRLTNLRRPALLLVLGIVGISGTARADWVVQERMALPRAGQVDLATVVQPHEDPVRFALTGSFSFQVDGSEVDAFTRTVNGQRDEAGAAMVTLPPGARIVSEDPAAHRYVLEVPRQAQLPIGLNLFGLSTRHLMTVSEVDANLSGAIELEHLVPPAPPPTTGEVAVSTAVETAEGIGAGPLALMSAGGLGFGLFGLLFVRRRRERIATLLRRARRARSAIAKEALAIGPAFDPVAATADRLLEATTQQAAHVRSMDAALQRTAWADSNEARARRVELEVKRDESMQRLQSLVARLESTATELAGRAADTERASGVDRLVEELGMDLDAAGEAEDELARI
ncbi:MAG: hypothetical protein AB8I08_33675 [Sandaracinaceae bacterium]